MARLGLSHQEGRSEKDSSTHSKLGGAFKDERFIVCELTVFLIEEEHVDLVAD